MGGGGAVFVGRGKVDKGEGLEIAMVALLANGERVVVVACWVGNLRSVPLMRKAQAEYFFRQTAGGIFLFDPMCLCSKYSEFCGEFKNG